MWTSVFVRHNTGLHNPGKNGNTLMTSQVISLEAFNCASFKSDGEMYCLDLQVFILFVSFPPPRKFFWQHFKISKICFIFCSTFTWLFYISSWYTTKIPSRAIYTWKLNFYITENTDSIRYKYYPINFVHVYTMSSINNNTKHINTLVLKCIYFTLHQLVHKRRQCAYNVILRRVGLTIVAVGNQ